MTHIPDGYRVLAVTYALTASQRPAVVTMAFQWLGTDFQADTGAVEASYLSKVNSSVNGNYVVTNMDWHAPGGVVKSAVTNTPGGKSGAMAAPNNTYLITKLTANPGRKGRGRLFLPGVNEAETGNIGEVIPSMKTELFNGFMNWRGDCIAAHMVPVVLHNDPLTPPYSITSFAVGNLIGDVKRRLKI